MTQSQQNISLEKLCSVVPVFAQDVLHDIQNVELISARRGIAVWRVVFKSGDAAALKFSIPVSSHEVSSTVSSALSREIAALLATRSKQFNPLLSVDRSEPPQYLATRWDSDLQPAAKIAESARGRNDFDALRDLCALYAGAVSEIHKAGWLHGDLQPGHFLVSEDFAKQALIDWGLARPIAGSEFSHPGCFVHYAAPEIAESMLEGKAESGYDVQAEIYALAASMVFLLTGKTAVDYGDEPSGAGRFGHRIGRVISGSHIRNFTPERLSAQAISLIKQALGKRSERPTAKELANALGGGTYE